MHTSLRWLLAVILAPGLISGARAADEPFDVAIPNQSLKAPFKDQAPIVFVSRSQNKAEWDKLPSFWNEATEDVADPTTGEKVTRRIVKIKVPLGLSTGPAIPQENPLTVAKWELGKKLYYDPILSTNNTVSCATCHSPTKGYGDAAKSSTGINGGVGDKNAPTVLNSGYNILQFWDGRAASLEEQAQGPVGNPIEMFSGKGDAWKEAVERLRAKPEYVKAFQAVFGHGPTRDAAAKAIASYERTVLSGNSIYDRAEVAMRTRVTEEESGKFEFKAEDFAKVITAAFSAKDTNALKALGLDPEKDAEKAAEYGKKLAQGREVFFGKARCANCHVGDNFTDNTFHNIGVGVKNQQLAEADFGRFNRLSTGHKDPKLIGAFKTPGLRGLASTGPFMHDGSEKTLEEVVEYYDRGGNLNEFLDAKMRDLNAEQQVAKLRAQGAKVKLGDEAMNDRSGAAIIQYRLKLTAEEKANLVLFMKSLQGDPVDASVADPNWFPKAK